MGMDKEQSARKLFLKTLKKLGVKVDILDEFIWFDFQDMDFDAGEDKSDRYITLEHMELKDLGDAESAERMRRIINKVGRNCDVVISLNLKYIHYRRKILFIEEIPNLEDYLRAEFQELMRAIDMFNEELQKELAKENKNVGQNDSKDLESTPTKDLFIETITDMDSEYEVWHEKNSNFESIVFDYQTVKWRATFFEYSRKVLIENLYSICGVELNNADKLKRLREFINDVNQEYDATAFYDVDYKRYKMYAEVGCTIPFMSEMPHLISYLHSVLSDLYCVYTDIKFEMEEPDEIEDKYHLYQEPS
jgi:hypothetical protein